jgi:hypothetical protein
MTGYVEIDVVEHDSPFEGGLRGMFFLLISDIVSSSGHLAFLSLGVTRVGEVPR